MTEPRKPLSSLSLGELFFDIMESCGEIPLILRATANSDAITEPLEDASLESDVAKLLIDVVDWCLRLVCLDWNGGDLLNLQNMDSIYLQDCQMFKINLGESGMEIESSQIVTCRLSLGGRNRIGGLRIPSSSSSLMQEGMAVPLVLIGDLDLEDGEG